MIILQPSYYKDFKCVGNKCLNTCCSGWRITIDKKSFFKYKKIEGEFGKKVKAGIKRERKNPSENRYGIFALDENTTCPLLNEDKLCELYINKGESYLCKTCTKYPRMGFIYKNMSERNLSATCPEVAKRLVYTKEKFSFDIEEDLGKEKDYYINLSSIDNDLLYNMLYESRNLAIDIVQIDGIPIWKRLIFVEFLQKRIQKLMDNNEIDKYPTILKEFLEEIEGCITDNSITEVNTQLKHKVISIIMKNQEGIFFEANETLFELLQGKENEEIINILKEKEKEFNEYFKEREYIYENYIVYKNLKENIITTILDFAVLKVLLFTQWIKHKELKDEDVAEVIWRFTRRMENNDDFLRNLYEWVLENNIDRSSLLATLIY